MKTKTKLQKLEHEIGDVLKKPLHLRFEYFFRKRYCLLAVMALMSVAMVKSDGKFLGIMRDAYNHNYSIAGRHLREEPVHSLAHISVVRMPSVASR
jgi:hypothetical protein